MKWPGITSASLKQCKYKISRSTKRCLLYDYYKIDRAPSIFVLTIVPRKHETNCVGTNNGMFQTTTVSVDRLGAKIVNGRIQFARIKKDHVLLADFRYPKV